MEFRQDSVGAGHEFGANSFDEEAGARLMAKLVSKATPKRYITDCINVPGNLRCRRFFQQLGSIKPHHYASAPNRRPQEFTFICVEILDNHECRSKIPDKFVFPRAV
jgi:hypothetical protein